MIELGDRHLLNMRSARSVRGVRVQYNQFVSLPSMFKKRLTFHARVCSPFSLGKLGKYSELARADRRSGGGVPERVTSPSQHGGRSLQSVSRQIYVINFSE